MRFNSVKRGNFSGLARSVNRSMDQVFDASRQTSVDHTSIAKESIKGRSQERRAAMKAESAVSRAGLQAVGQVKGYKEKAGAIRDEGKKKAGKARMAGALGALGSLAGGFVMKSGQDKQDARDAARDAESKAWQEEMLSVMSRPTPKPEELPAPPVMETPDLETPGDSPSSTPTSGDSSSSTATSGDSSVPTTYKSKPLAGSMDISKLTDDDFKHLAYAISSEAGPGKDRYGVAASILNRVASDKWPGTVKDVIFQDGQYEGVYKGLSKWDSGIASDLSSDTGRAEILKALNTLDGRTDFKGQSMLKYRSNKGNKGGIMDPMFDPKGNFFHYSHQT